MYLPWTNWFRFKNYEITGVSLQKVPRVWRHGKILSSFAFLFVTDILLLYIHEDEDFYTSFVTTHTGHLKSIIPCNFVDSRDVRHQSMPNSWLTSQTHRCHVLVYVSPLLLQCLYGQNFTSNNAYHTIIVEAVRSLTDRTFSRHKRAVFVLSGCCGLNADAAGRLTRDFNLPCHLVAQNRDGPEGGVTLNSPCSLLHEILGTKMCPCFTYLACSDSTGTARSLLQALQRLQNSSQYSDEYISGFLSSAPCHGATDSPYRSQCLPEDCNVSLLNGVDSGFEPGGKGSNSDLSSSPPCTFINHEDTSEMDLYQYQVIEGSRGINPETISFIRPEELMSCSGSQINIEKCLHTINENSGRHWWCKDVFWERGVLGVCTLKFWLQHKMRKRCFMCVCVCVFICVCMCVCLCFDVFVFDLFTSKQFHSPIEWFQTIIKITGGKCSASKILIYMLSGFEWSSH